MLLLNWSTHESTQKPNELDMSSSPTTVYLRKDIYTEERSQPTQDDKDASITMYVYKEATLSFDEYNEYLQETESVLVQSMSQQINDLKVQNDELTVRTQKLAQMVSDISLSLASNSVS